jgi:hypothetical protein
MVGMTVDGVSSHHSNVGFRRVGAGSEPAPTIVSIVLMCDGDAVYGARLAVPLRRVIHCIVWARRYVGLWRVGAGSEPARTID